MTGGPDTNPGISVSLRSVSVAYTSESGSVVEAVSGVSLDIEAGSIVALLGPSGCGKTSLLRAIAGLEQPVDGEITVGATVVSRRSPASGSGNTVWVNPERRGIGMVFQDGALFPHLSVRQNIVFGLRARRRELSKDALLSRVDDLLELVDLPGYGDRMPETLSGGQQQRVALARSLAPQPSVLLLDEPFSALDAALRIQVRSEVARIVRDVGVTTIFVTHDQDEAFVLGDEVAVMNAGRVEQFGTPDELYRSPSTPWVAGFVGEANFLGGTLDAGATEAGLATTSLGVIAIDDQRADRSTPTVHVLVRPEQVAMAALPHPRPPSSRQPDSTAGALATVTAVEYYGHDVRYELDLDDGSSLAARTHSTELFARGDRVVASFRSNERDSRSAAFAPR